MPRRDFLNLLLPPYRGLSNDFEVLVVRLPRSPLRVFASVGYGRADGSWATFLALKALGLPNSRPRARAATRPA